MRRLYFIVNPISGSGQGGERFERIRATLERMGADFGFVYSQYPGHATELARLALDAGEKRIVAVGGDGTMREVASMLADVPGVEFGILPFGTGNDFARGMGLPDDDEKLIDTLLRGTAVPVDAGDVNGEFFMNVAGFGFDVDVVRYTEKYKKKLNGMLPYMLGILKSLLYLSKTQISVETDTGERFDVNATLFSVCNGSRFAGGIKLAPLSDPGDGQFDVCILKSVNRLVFLYLLPIYIRGGHLKYKKYFMYFKASRVSAQSTGGVPMELDGELIGETPARFTIRPGALRVLTYGEQGE